MENRTVFAYYSLVFISCVSYQAHIGNILKSKFIGYKDFDTLMYTCAAEFDFMEKEVIWSKYVILEEGTSCFIFISNIKHFRTPPPTAIVSSNTYLKR